jgi:hypothetical protein
LKTREQIEAEIRRYKDKMEIIRAKGSPREDYQWISDKIEALRWVLT